MCNKRANTGYCNAFEKNMTKCLSLWQWTNYCQYIIMYIAKIPFFWLYENNRLGFCPLYRVFENFFSFSDKKRKKNICFTKKCCTFATQLSIGLWCNGNTADSGPAFPGSSPGSPTESFSYAETLFLYMWFMSEWGLNV